MEAWRWRVQEKLKSSLSFGSSPLSSLWASGFDGMPTLVMAGAMEVHMVRGMATHVIRGTGTATVAAKDTGSTEMPTPKDKALPWARVIQPLIPLEDDLRYNGIISTGNGYGDGWEYGNGGGDGLGVGLDNRAWDDGDGDGIGEWGYENGDGFCDMY